MFLKTNAIRTAGDHAATYYRSNPRMNLASIHADSLRAEAMDSLSFLTGKTIAGFSSSFDLDSKPVVSQKPSQADVPLAPIPVW